MTTFTSRVELGKKYKDSRFGLEGFAVAICFNSEGCVEVILAHAQGEDDKLEIKRTLIDELRLVTPNGDSIADEKHEYVSDLVFNHRYEDIQLGLRGYCSIVEFHEEMPARGILRVLGVDNDGGQAIKYHSIDDFLLKDLGTNVVAEKKDDKKSPVSHEVFPR